MKQRKLVRSIKKSDELDYRFSESTKNHKLFVDTLTLAEIVAYAVEQLNLKTLVADNLKLYKEEANNAYQ